MTDTRPPVAPKEGFYAMLRNGMIARPIIDDHAWLRQGLKQNVDPYLELVWFDDGRCHPSSGLEEFTDEYDIIATFSHEDLQTAIMLADVPAIDVSKALAAGLVEPTTVVETTPPQSTWLSFDMAKLIAAADAACDYADQNCRALPIATAPRDGTTIEVWNDVMGKWFKVKFETRRQCWINIMVSFDNDMHDDGAITHWRPLPPPPTNPPLPEVFTQLGQALEKIKEGR